MTRTSFPALLVLVLLVACGGGGASSSSPSDAPPGPSTPSPSAPASPAPSGPSLPAPSGPATPAPAGAIPPQPAAGGVTPAGSSCSTSTQVVDGRSEFDERCSSGGATRSRECTLAAGDAAWACLCTAPGGEVTACEAKAAASRPPADCCPAE